MKNAEYITIIDQAFKGMQERNEETTIVRYFQDTKDITLLSGRIMQCEFVKIILKRIKGTCFIKILYCSNNGHELMPFTSKKDKQNTVQMLRNNKILPTAKEFLDARSLLNSISCKTVENIIHGDTIRMNKFPVKKLQDPTFGYNIP